MKAKPGDTVRGQLIDGYGSVEGVLEEKYETHPNLESLVFIHTSNGSYYLVEEGSIELLKQAPELPDYPGPLPLWLAALKGES